MCALLRAVENEGTSFYVCCAFTRGTISQKSYLQRQKITG
jgi:hypothetical protein